MNHRNYKLLSFILFLILINLNFLNCLHFDFGRNQMRCYLEDFAKGSHVGISYKVWSKEKKDSEYVNTKIIPKIQIKILNDRNKILYSEKLKSSNNKFSYVNRKDGTYQICAEYFSGWNPDMEIFMKLNFISENMEEPNIIEAIKEQDLDPVKKSLKEVMKKGKKFIKMQEEELALEDVNAMKHMKTVSNYYKLTVFQIVAFILLGVYQLYSYRKLLNN